MRTYALSHLSDSVLLHDLRALIVRERQATAVVLAHIAEVDARRLYLPAGFPSMHAYCVGELRLSEDAAWKRLQAARAARRLPALFMAIAEGRLHLSAVCLLAPHLTPANADDLIAAATHKTKSQVELLLAERFPRPDPAPFVVAVAPIAATGPAQPAPGQVGGALEAGCTVGPATGPMPVMLGGVATSPAPGQVNAPRHPVLKPIAPERFVMQVAIGRSTHDKLRHAQALLSHQLPSGDVASVIDRALDALIARLEKQKCGVTARPRPATAARPDSRHVPAHVRRAVWARDQGRCTFVGENGHRCESRKFLQFDHEIPVARGGEATVANTRLRCRGHNQYEADCAFGAGFMSLKRGMAG